MEKKTIQQVPKIAITPNADEVLKTAYEKVNSGFLGGKVSKLDLASWALLDSLENLAPGKIEKIRKRFFNEICYLESVVKLSRQERQEKLTDDQLATIQNLFGQKADKSKAKPQKEPESNDLHDTKISN